MRKGNNKAKASFKCLTQFIWSKKLRPKKYLINCKIQNMMRIILLGTKLISYVDQNLLFFRHIRNKTRELLNGCSNSPLERRGKQLQGIERVYLKTVSQFQS